MQLAPDRVEVLRRIEEYERLGYFDRDVENDPPTRPLKPGEVDYTLKKLSSRIASEFANEVARRHFDKCIKRGELVIREVRGLEHYLAVKDRGVMITANHFNAFDNYAVFKAIQKELGRKRLYKIIREGNYTSFGGLYGYFFRHCNTLPLSADHRAFRELRDAIAVLLSRGEKILIYPEQGMWWNYRKPRPLKPGAFRFAAINNAPILPFFLTMEDTDRIGADGYPIQAYTVHILPAIFPDPALTVRENSERMCTLNYNVWKQTYEQFYGIELTYTTEQKEDPPCSIS
jgi:1-acyl-sn-glycerol-3-phosphate acyltransferase